MAKCSPDGRWLAFEYHDASEPLSPRIGIVRRNRSIASWRPLVNSKKVDYLGDFSWSPDGRWLSAIEDDSGGSDDLESDLQVVKVSPVTGRVFSLTHLPPGSILGPGTAWVRSGLIIFPGLQDGGIYGVPAKGGKVRELVSLPTQKCGHDTDTFAVSPDERRIAFWISPSAESQEGACDALWIADMRTGAVRAVPTAGLYPVTPFWLNSNTILFSGMDKDERPLGIYEISLSSGTVTPVLKGLYLSPFVCGSGRTLYFSWAPKLAAKDFVWHSLHISNLFHGFHIWKVPLQDALRQHAGKAVSGVKGTPGVRG